MKLHLQVNLFLSEWAIADVKWSGNATPAFAVFITFL